MAAHLSTLGGAAATGPANFSPIHAPAGPGSAVITGRFDLPSKVAEAKEAEMKSANADRHGPLFPRIAHKAPPGQSNRHNGSRSSNYRTAWLVDERKPEIRKGQPLKHRHLGTAAK
ncbi:hypothetical protein CDAR_492601 [Caerostris darwini]|uniref:Uncharacterized protein n=1 Tax=Caerostris darwini TaxID=1538125 RepID=A0AAV4UZJ3_9ARAC|nr:hypothetical protein CDAR_492601 [Caerostris darwini]